MLSDVDERRTQDGAKHTAIPYEGFVPIDTRDNIPEAVNFRCTPHQWTSMATQPLISFPYPITHLPDDTALGTVAATKLLFLFDLTLCFCWILFAV